MSIASRVAPISINRRNPSPSSPHFNVTLGPINRNPYLRTESNSSRQQFLRMAMDARLVSSSSASSSLLLTSGASGRINALFSRRAMMSLLMLIHAFVLLLLLPFRWRPKRVAGSASTQVAEKGMDDKKQMEGGGASGHNNRKVGSAVVRVRTPWWKAAAVVEQEVAMRRALAKRRVLQDDDENCVREFSLFTTARGATLFTQSWTPVNAKMRGLVVLLHGLNEHSGRYNNFAKKLNANGFKVYGMDWIELSIAYDSYSPSWEWNYPFQMLMDAKTLLCENCHYLNWVPKKGNLGRGHGGSDGLHSYVHSLDIAVSDLKAFIERVQSENPGYPCFCFGHSTGAAIILKAALDPKVETRVAGLVITSPAVGVQPSHPIYTVLAPIVSILFPRYQIGAANKKGLPVSRDPAALVEKYSDPLVYTGSIRVRTGYEILRIASFLQRNLNRLTVPFLVLHGTADTVTDPKASLKLYQEASSTDKTIKLLEGYMHDLLFEPEKESIAEDIIQWLNSRVQ